VAILAAGSYRPAAWAGGRFDSTVVDACPDISVKPLQIGIAVSSTVAGVHHARRGKQSLPEEPASQCPAKFASPRVDARPAVISVEQLDPHAADHSQLLPVPRLILPGVLLIALGDGGVAEWLKAAVC